MQGVAHLVSLRRRPRLRGLLSEGLSGPVPWKQVGELRLRDVGDAGEDVGEPGLRIDFVEFRGLCRPPNYAERSGRKPSLARTCGPSSGHRPSSIRHSLASYSASRKASRRSLGWKRVRLPALVRLELRQGGFLECEMGMQVGLRRFDRLMTEPQRDHGAIDARLQQLHCSAVPQHVRRHSLGRQ